MVFASKTTAAVCTDLSSTSGKVVYNGVAGPVHPRPMTYDGGRPLRVLVPCRSGQSDACDTLVRAVQAIPLASRSRLAIRVLASDAAPALRGVIADSGLAATITVTPWVRDLSEALRWADVVSVPYDRPDELDSVCFEALAWGRPLLVPNVGVAAEVVQDGRTGWLVAPGDAIALALALESIVVDPKAWAGFPSAARADFAARFRIARTVRDLCKALTDALPSLSSAASPERPKQEALLHRASEPWQLDYRQQMTEAQDG